MIAPIEHANGEEVELEAKAEPITLKHLAQRLCPNPAITVAGTLQVLLSGIDNLDEELFARALGCAGARAQGLDVGIIPEAQWREADFNLKIQLLKNAKAMKAALRMMSEL